MTNPTQHLNLLNPTPERVLARPRGFYKEIVFDGLTVLAAFAVGYFYSHYIGRGLSLWIFLGSLLGYSVLSSLENFFSPTLRRRSVIILLEAIALLLPFYSLPFFSLLMTAGAIVVFLLLGAILSRRELENSLRIRFFAVLRAYATKFVTGMVLAGIFIYFPLWSQKNFEFSRESYDTLYAAVDEIVGRLYPKINLNVPFREFAIDAIRPTLEDDPRYQELPFDLKQASLHQTVDQFLGTFREKFGIEIQGDQNVGDALYQFLTGLMRTWQKGFGQFFAVGWMVVAFLIVRSFGAIFVAVISGVAFLCYHILFALNVVTLVNASTSQEIIEYA